VGPWPGGAIYDLAGSYRHAFAVSIVSLALAAASFWAAGRGQPGMPGG
jgi:cyanate permease